MNIIVQMPTFESTTGTLIAGGKRYECTLGRTGVTLQKEEGDGKTPLGTYPFREVLYRADRVAKPDTGLPVEVLTGKTGWCEDPSHPDYNLKVTLPHPAMCDDMTREDHVYDIVAVIGYNDDPVEAGRGSAIFMHLARENFSPTQGCIGLVKSDLLEVLKICDEDTTITILPPA